MTSPSWTVPRAISHFLSSKSKHNNPRLGQDGTPTIPDREYETSNMTNGTPLNTSSTCFSDRLKVFVGTWNMYGRLLPIDLSTFLTKNEIVQNTTSKNFSLDGSVTHPYHLLVIGTQECERDISESLFYPSKEVWEKRLSDYLGSHYKMVKTETLAALHIAVFVWTPVEHLVKDVQSDSIKTGWANMVGNKGAVAVSVLFGSRSLLFINCHLTAHQTKLTERNANIQRILYELKIPSFKSGKKQKKLNPSVIDQFDHVFLFGDTNYRINAERPFVFDALKMGDYNTLLEYDQLSAERRTEGSPLGFFQEHPIQFPPTYKLDTIVANSSTTNETEVSYPLSKTSSRPNNNTSTSLSTASTSSLPTHMATSAKIAATKENMKATFQNTKSRSVKSIKRRLSARKKATAAAAAAAATPALSSGQDDDSSHNSPVSMCDSKIALVDSPNTTLCYDSSEKQRVPSWTDRILWCDRAATHHMAPPSLPDKSKRTNSTKSKRHSTKLFSSLGLRNRRQFSRDTICYSYNAVLHESLMGVSDHMPVVGVFGIWFDEWVPAHHPKMIRLPLRKSSTLQSKNANNSNGRKKKNKKRGWWKRLFG